MSRTISTSSTGITLSSTADNPVSVTSTGAITSSAGNALYGQGGGKNSWTIDNSGLISGGGLGNAGVALGSGGSPVVLGIITNESTGSISGSSYGISINPTGSVINAGAIS